MQFIFTTIFIILLTMFLYGYFSYFNKHIPKCNVIYILHDGFEDNPDPDYYHGNSENLFKLG